MIGQRALCVARRRASRHPAVRRLDGLEISVAGMEFLRTPRREDRQPQSPQVFVFDDGPRQTFAGTEIAIFLQDEDVAEPGEGRVVCDYARGRPADPHGRPRSRANARWISPRPRASGLAPSRTRDSRRHGSTRRRVGLCPYRSSARRIALRAFSSRTPFLGIGHGSLVRSLVGSAFVEPATACAALGKPSSAEPREKR
jgi:hypothetical protein